MPRPVYPDHLEQWASEFPDAIWLRDRRGDVFTDSPRTVTPSS